MRLTITNEEFGMLSLPTRKELLSFFTDGIPNDNNRFNMSPKLAQKFINGCSDVTVGVLKAFVKDGTADVNDLLDATGYKDPADLRGVLAGITKRTRGLSGDSGATLLEWVADRSYPGFDGRWKGYWRVSDQTQKSLGEIIQ